MSRVAWIVFLLACSIVSLQAQTGPDLDADATVGYVNNVFHNGQIDSINVYNGQLTVPIPLGPSYQIGPKLKVQAMVTYGSRVYDYGHPHTQVAHFNFVPLAGDPALGIGWTFTFGSIKEDCLVTAAGTNEACFAGPDGSRHLFEYQVQGTTADYKTTDASQLYLHKKSDGSYQMWDADGTRYDFTWQVSGFDDSVLTEPGYTHDFGRGRDGWYATAVTDSFGNSYTVDYYDTARDSVSFPCWTYNDSNCASGAQPTHMICAPAGKTHTWIPRYIYVPGNTPIHVHYAAGEVTSIDFPTINGVLATWGLGYSPANTNWPCYPNGTGGTTYTNITIGQLTSITLPSGIATYGFQYGYTANGLLTHIDLPTLGTVDYCYSQYTFYHGRLATFPPFCSATTPSGADAVFAKADDSMCGSTLAADWMPLTDGIDCTGGDNPLQYTDTQLGVVRRSERAVAGGTAAMTKYTQYSFPWGEQGDSMHTTGGSQTLTVVVSPADNDGHVSSTASLFYSGPKNPSATFYNGDRIGAPIQERAFDSDPTDSLRTMPLCGGTTEAKYCASKAVRVTTRTYDYDIQTTEIHNRRLSSETVCYGSLSKSTGNCSTNTSHKVAYTPTNTCGTGGTSQCDWDADNGRHYNLEQHTNNAGTVLRATSTHWTPSSWDTTPSAAALPNLFSSRTITEGTYIDYEYPAFDALTGFQNGTIRWDQGSGVVWFQCRYNDGQGNAGNEFTATATGFTSPPPTGACQTGGQFDTWAKVVAAGAFGNSDAFGKGRTFQNGLLETSAWFDSVQGAQQQLGWFSRNYTRDRHTGWITNSADAGGQSTSYAYDSIGRVTTVTPPGETAISVSYDTTTQTTVTRGGSTWEQYIYDGLGRLVREINQTGSSTYAVRTHGFDGPGREFFTSEWGSCTTPAGDCLSASPLGTTRSLYDPFGRPQAVTGPSNATYVATSRTDGSILYSDTKESVSQCVNGTWNGSACSGTTATTVSVKDLFGRLTSVAEPSGGSTATYAYDVNDKLRSVSQGGQSRTFTYNSFGYLTQEVTPEKGTVKYTTGDADRYGSLGNPRTKVEGTVTHGLTYDGAGRLAQDMVGSTQYLLNCYDGNGSAATSTCKDGSSNSNGGPSSGGKLTRRTGANPMFVPLNPQTATTEFLREDLSYNGRGGRLSSKQTTMLGSTGLTIGGVSQASETWTYNTLGLVDTHNHPRVGGVANEFEETLSYSYGRLNALTVAGADYDSSAIVPITITPTFRAAGNLGSYTAQQNGAAKSLVTIIYQDTSGIPRPRQIQGSVSGSPLFDTGAMSYDAAGNIMAMGSDSFGYDSVSRLTSASYSGTPQGFTYDAWGNLTAVTGANARSLPTSTTTNRLTNGAYGDGRGNLTQFGSERLCYDADNRQAQDSVGGTSCTTGTTWQYLFSGADERLARVPNGSSLPVPRREIARYIVQGKPFTPATSCTEGVPFGDVHCADPDFGYIKTISDQGLTSGCGGGNYCPDVAVTRGQASVLFMKAEHGSTNSPTCHGTYVDAPCSDPTAAFIEEAITEGVLLTCSSGHACPSNPLTELDAVKGMADGNLWPNYKPIAGGSLYTLRDDNEHVVTEFADSLPSRDNVYIGNIVVASYLGKQPGSAGSWQFHSSDHLGTIRLTVDAATCGTNFLQQTKYWPYGEQASGPVSLQRLGFAALERDSENSHYYDHARHHDLNLGRFVSADSAKGVARDPQTWNRYAYARNNPTRFVDPNGLWFSLAGDTANRDWVQKAAVQFIMRPTGRAAYLRVANAQTQVKLTTGNTANRAQIAVDIKDGKNPTVQFAEHGEGGEGSLKLTFDVNAHQDFAARSAGTTGAVDAGGVTSFGHELSHAVDALFNGNAAYAAGDYPSSAAGSAMHFGQSVFKETPDITEQEAERIFLGTINKQPEPGPTCERNIAGCPPLQAPQ